MREIDRVIGRIKHQRTRLQHVRQRARIILRLRCDLGKSDVTGRLDEFAKSPVRHWSGIHPEPVDRDTMDRRFFRIMLVRSHAERTAGNEPHVGLLSVSGQCGVCIGKTHGDLT
jgi:hypothetical protein